MIGFKIDNCSNKKNIELFNKFIKHSSPDMPFEFGLECYEGERSFITDSRISKKVFDFFSSRNNNIVHMNLKAKLLNKNELSKKEWLDIWDTQFKMLDKVNVSYLVIHATNREAKTLEENEQIDIILNNFHYLKSISPFKLFIENTYEDFPFYEKILSYAGLDMGFVLDIGHKKVHSKYSNAEWVSFIERVKKHGIHYHIHDNNGIYDLHKPVSFYSNPETLEFISNLKKLNAGNMILENHGESFSDNITDLNLITEV
jgi:sugar phosphate isomerase/epimerase